MAKKHWVYIKRGLSEDPKHRAAMGECIWLYMHIIDRADWETGIAFDWKDREEAADMGMEFRTLRYQRQKLESLDYIRCTQKQHSQDIKIMEWINPRDYSAGVVNRRDSQGTNEVAPYEGTNKTAPSEFQGDNQGTNQGTNQGSSQISTPTYTSKSKSGSDKPAPVFDFENMTIPQAYKVPTLKMYNEAAGWLPADILWRQVHEYITAHNLTEEQIKTAAVAWVGRGYNRRNVMGILEWAANGTPGNGQKAGDPKPAIDEQRVSKTVEELAERWSFKPAPPPSSRPRIGRRTS